MKISGKCVYCGAEGEDVFEVKPPKTPERRGESVLTLGVSLLIIALFGLGFSGYFAWESMETEEEIEARITEHYKDECWVAGIQKELGLPKATDEELWCEAHGHCGPARQGLASEVDFFSTELDKVLPQYHDALKQLAEAKAAEKEAREDAEEAYDDEHKAVLLVEAYAEASIASICAEEVQDAWEWAQDWEVKYFDCAQRSHRDYVKIEYAEDRLGRRIDEKTALAWWQEDE